jgi:hypothetical protein
LAINSPETRMLHEDVIVKENQTKINDVSHITQTLWMLYVPNKWIPGCNICILGTWPMQHNLVIYEWVKLNNNASHIKKNHHFVLQFSCKILFSELWNSEYLVIYIIS